MMFALLVFFITSARMSAQAPNPPYLSEMPSVGRCAKMSGASFEQPSNMRPTTGLQVQRERIQVS
jgi:hypothetical protein